LVNAGTHKLLRIGELSRLTGVSTSAINYYVREGLLPPPLKTAPNMAYYDPGYIDMVNSIRVFKREKGLSLTDIKELLERGEFSWTEGSPPEDLSGAVGTTKGTRRALDRRKHIMSVAARVFAEKGYYAATISDLARAAGIAKGTIYWYFDNKRSIMLALLDDLSHEIVETFSGIMRDAANGLDAILDCIEPALLLLERHGAIYIMYFLEIGSTDSEIQLRFRRIYKVVHAGTRLALERGISEGVIRDMDPHIGAYGVMGLVERVSEIGMSRDRVPLQKKVDETREMVRGAIASDATGGSPAPGKKGGSR
jgi:AcrR family transcriptional regulator/predicted DNA-binding transcriptional regulator AlpA